MSCRIKMGEIHDHFSFCPFLWFGLLRGDSLTNPKVLHSSQKDPSAAKNHYGDSKNSELLRRSVFPTPPEIYYLSAPQRCNAQRSDAQRKFFTTLSISLFLQRHRCDALPCFSASPVEIFYIAHIALRPLLPFFLSPQWFTVQNNKKFAKSHNAAMSPLATRDGQRNAQRTTQRCGALSLLRRRPFLERENVCNFQENGVRIRHAAIVNHSAVVNSLRVVNLLRVLFLVRRGPAQLP